MKKINIILFAIFITLPALGESVSKPIAKFNALNSFISCQVDIAPLEIKSIDGYAGVKSPDCYQSTEVGKPCLPVRSFFVLLPPNSDVKDITLTEIEQIALAGEHDIKPVLPPVPISKGSTSTHPIVPSEDFYPENIVEISSIQKLRGYTIACISIFGACYHPKTKQLIWNKQIDFKLNITTSKIKAISPTIRGLEEDEELVKELVINPELTSSYDVRIKPLTSTDTYTYVIITSENLLDAFKPLLDFKINQKGLTGTIATTEWIYSTYKGNDRQEQIKAFIRAYYKSHYTRYVLLGGDTNIIPYRGVYAKVPKGSNLGDYVDSAIPCDLYYACFDSDWDWDTDNDKIYGELGEDNIDLMSEVYIGRAPVSNSSEVSNFVNKVITCENSQNNYIYNELLIGYILLHNPLCDGKDIMEEIAYNTPITYTIHKEYESEGSIDTNKIINSINSGVGLIAHANHANWNEALPFNIGYPIDVKTLNNGNKTFIFNTIGCIAGDFSKTYCIGEEMLLNANGGAVTFIGNSRYGWFDETNVKLYSGEYQIKFFKKFFKEGYARIGETLGKSKMEFILMCNEHNPYRWIMFCLNLLGDPVMEFRAAKEIFHIDHTIEEVIGKPGEGVNLIVTLKNLTEGTITGVSGTISTTDQYITIIKNTADFGTISSKGTAINSSNPYQIMVKSNCPLIHKIDFLLTIGGQGDYKNIDKFSVMINLKVDNLSKVIHYPNPCYPDEDDVLKIANIPLNSNPKIYIYNLAGELIRVLDDEIRKYSRAEIAYWDAKNEEGKDVTFGVYIYILKCDVGTKKGKIAIIR